MNAIPDHYAALGIDPTADPEVITAAYRALAKKFHPDTGATTGTASAERFEQVQRAYEVLRTPESRRRYDLELLAQAERDLEEHLARKRRALPRAAGLPPEAPTKPDLGAIRPEPSGAAGQGHGSASQPRSGERRPIGPFLIPAVLLLALLGGLAWLFLPAQLAAPPAAVAEAPATAPKAPEPEAATPVFGTGSAETEAATTLDEPKLPAPKADAEPAPTPVPASATPEEDVRKPVFGSSVTEQAEAKTAPAPAVAPPAPAPKPPRKVKPKPAPVEQAAVPRRQAENSSAYTLIIFERRRRGKILSQQADIQFASRGSCIEFGVKAVLRRMSERDMNPRRRRIWYECQPVF